MSSAANSATVLSQEPASDIASLRRVWTLTGSHGRPVLCGLACRFAQSGFLGLSFAAVVWVVTELAGGRVLDTGWLGQIIMLLALSLAGQLLFGYLAARYSWLSGFRIARDLRLSLLEHLRRLPLGFHLSRSRGDTLSVLTGDMQMVESFFSDGLPRIAQALGLPLALLTVFAFRSPEIALATAISMIAGAPVFVWSSRSLARLGIVRQDRQAEAAEKMIEYARGMPVIRSFNRVASGQERFTAALAAFRDISIAMVSRLALPMVAFGAIVVLGVPVLMVSSWALHLDGAFDRGDILSVLVLAFSFYTPLLGLVSVMELARLADASLTRIERIMAARPLPPARRPQKPCGFGIRFDRVGFSYDGRRRVLAGVSLDVPERSMTALVGSSGSGKSTFLNLIPRFFEVTEGSISIGGVDIRDLSEEDIAGLITVVFQDVHLFSGTIAENIAFAKPGATRQEIEEAARQAQAHDFITALPGGYDTQVGEGGSSLSGGERQRISIARALLKDAPIVLLDEATAAIDPVTERDLRIALARLVADRTLIVVAHKLSTITNADQIVVLEMGAVVERGTDSELSRLKGRYAQLTEARRRAEAWNVR
ncbi:ABC transporter ATP-binding protein [Neorhizobium sp. DT-125]|uniref:ABC transporter ATP-binding protein n=1 Tax=Neorhizobium sp. DT-125 TaxID=3396163 RepID=UPI003F1C76C9